MLGMLGLELLLEVEAHCHRSASKIAFLHPLAKVS
jgi:hypothetical protein